MALKSTRTKRKPKKKTNRVVASQSVPTGSSSRNSNVSNLANPNARRYTNESIENKVFNRFLNCKIQKLSMSLIRSGPLPIRPFNIFNVERIAASSQNGYTANESIAVVQTQPNVYDCIYGNQRYLGYQQASGRDIPCLIIDDLPSPTEEDLEFAALTAHAYSPKPAPRSFIPQVFEVRTILAWIVNHGKSISNVTYVDVKSCLPKKVINSASKYSSVEEHWTHGGGGDNKIMKVLGIAKVFAGAGMDNLLDDIERTCYDPFKQVSRNVLIDIKNLELLKPGEGKKVLKRYFEEVNSGSADGSSSQHSSKKLKLTLSAVERNELQRLQEREKEGFDRSRRASRESVVERSSHDNGKRDAIKKMEKGLSILQDGLKDWDKTGHMNKGMTSIKKLVTELETAISSLE